MDDKKNAYKFTIQFNAADPHHDRVIGLLNAQGRRKAQFIVNAVLHYVACTKQPEDIVADNIDYGAVEVIVKKIVAEYNSPEKSDKDVSEKAVNGIESKLDSHTHEDTTENIEDNALKDIMTSMDMFRNRSNKEDGNP